MAGCNIASEVKSLVPVGAAVTEVPPGHHGWGGPGSSPQVTPYVDLMRLGEDEDPIEDPDEAMKLVRSALEDSIRIRVDTDLTVGVILSGGVDSALTLLHVQAMHPDCVAFTVGTSDSDDLRYARRLTSELGVAHEVIELRPNALRFEDVRTAIGMSELTEYGDIINALVSKPLFERVHRCGVKVVLSGDGSDELFGGYDMYRQVGDDLRQRLFQHKIRNLSRTELQRVDRTSMGNGVETRVPFLDLALVRLAMRLPIDLKVRDGVEKWVIRQAFADLLPDYIRRRPKNPMSHSSGLHEWVRLYKPLFARTYRSFGYDLAEPMRRDFSIVLDQHDLDLDRALAAAAARPDYTRLEHAIDLAGARSAGTRPPPSGVWATARGAPASRSNSPGHRTGRVDRRDPDPLTVPTAAFRPGPGNRPAMGEECDAVPSGRGLPRDRPVRPAGPGLRGAGFLRDLRIRPPLLSQGPQIPVHLLSLR